MVADLGATASETSLLRALPNITGLLVIFPAGVLGSRFGLRRVLVAGGCIVTLAAAGVFYATRRRHPDAPVAGEVAAAGPPAEGPPAGDG